MQKARECGSGPCSFLKNLCVKKVDDALILVGRRRAGNTLFSFVKIVFAQ